MFVQTTKLKSYVLVQTNSALLTESIIIIII